MADAESKDTRKIARVAGLNSFEIPSLEGVERRRFQLWTVAIALLLLLGLALDLTLLFPGVLLPDWLDPRVVQAGLLGMILLFGGYAIEKESQLRRLSRLLVEEKILSAALTARLREVSALLEAGRAVNLDLDLDEVLRRIAGCALDLLEGRDASVMLVHGRGELRTVAVAGWSGARGARLRFGEGIAGGVAASLEPVLVTGVVERPTRPGGTREHPATPESAMSVPLLHRDELVGVLNLNARPGRRYTEHDLRALGLFGEQAAAAIAHARLLESQRLAASRSRYQAFHDRLTGLPNRALFVDRVAQALRRRGSDARRFAVGYLDLDSFKRINDELGHEAGDRVLVAFADRLRRALRAGDTVARFGGDEFALLLEETRDGVEARGAAERILDALAAPIVVGERQVTLRASIGVALAGEADVKVAVLMERADLALRSAKRAGKGAVRLFEPRLELDAVAAEELAVDLASALDRGEFELFYQPIHLLASGHLLGVEGLLRWRHPMRGLLAAETFLPLAERLGLLAAIDRQSLGVACREVAGLDGGDDSSRRLSLFLHLDPVRLSDPELPREVLAALAESGLGPDRLRLELPEEAIFANPDATMPRLRGLREAGLRLALDDFGTGPAISAALDDLGVDTVKIDRLFVGGLDRDGGERALIQAVVRVATTLDLEVIAEGVEQEIQREVLLDLGCGAAQGQLLAPPMSASDLREFLSRSRP